MDPSGFIGLAYNNYSYDNLSNSIEVYFSNLIKTSPASGSM